ncbi:16S rRNA (guanine(966)-N(2))-methyltransferase RsmD [Carboxylicivirga sp. M1479]|uniref:16S rRNA (guanine(966)-N(2))-methyltransferase RsmD n=1 Tax=Carboxylicivirga sp. M1479 TaxID=2594476 RepID=UPI0011789B3C|nr:16S rRNA (guanine(966)-N(2))-methyltransferase RsmD [Carboxylicivirga sp. M1479]TRX70942.1 16S rRNA (guanine(966)-N(2))-methyltransferase RsmD [Carboxylicivirga sp. M1479]
MRIISGYLKGRRFSPPKSFKARPTTDIARESLFNVLNNRVDFEDLKVLDLFAGTGSISYEFASRGCTDVTTVEMNYKHYSYIKSMLAELELEDDIQLFKADAFKYMQKSSVQYDLVFADPPFDLKNFDSIPDQFFKNSLLKDDGIFILEHSDKMSFEKHSHFSELKKYGKVHFSFFKPQQLTKPV